MNNNPALGFEYLVAGFGLLFKPGIKRFVIIPVIINIILFIGLFFLLRHFMAEFNQWFAHFLPDWLQWLSYVLWVFFFISFSLIFIYTFVMMANLISAPFNSFLAEKIECHLGGLIQTRSLMDNIKDVPRIIGRQLSIIGYFLPRALLILVLFFVPVIQIVAAFIWFVFNAWFMALTYLDYPTDNHRIPLAHVKEWMQVRRWTSLGFGMGILFSAMIPILNFFTVPAAVAGATKYWFEENKRK